MAVSQAYPVRVDAIGEFGTVIYPAVPARHGRPRPTVEPSPNLRSLPADEG